MDFCHRHDTDFADQCGRLHYWRSYTNPALAPCQERIQQDPVHELLQPTVSYKSFCAEVNTFDVKFMVKRVDTCEECHAYRYTLQRSNINPELKAQVKVAFREHLHAADQGYAARTADHRRDEIDPTFFCRGIDFGGGLRNPMTTLNMAFYNRVLPMQNYIIAGPANADFYAWDERTGSKGVNEVLSCIRLWLAQLLREHPGAKHVVFWSDSCYGQSCNQFMARYLSECCDKTSQHYLGLETIELKTPPKGHSYLYPDRAIAQVKQRARKLGEGIVAGFSAERRAWKPVGIGSFATLTASSAVNANTLTLSL